MRTKPDQQSVARTALALIVGSGVAVALFISAVIAQSGSCIVTATRLNMRQGPGTSYRVVAQMTRNTRFTPIARNADASWLFGYGPETSGWAASTFLQCTVNISTLTVNPALVGQVTGAGGGTPIAPPTTTATPTTFRTPIVPPTMAPVGTSTPSPTPTASPTSPAPAARMTWVPIPAGDFVMGSSEADIWSAVDACNEWEDNCEFDWFSSEMPPRRFYLPTFSITKHEITNQQYGECVSASYCRRISPVSADGSLQWQAHYGGADYPIVGISYNDASRFCAWVGGALPSEVQWEKAARGADARIYPWGNTLLAGNANLRSGTLSPVGTYPSGASPYGVLDMAGNAFEWTSTSINGNTVLRGGSWTTYPFRGRTADRGTKLAPTFANLDIGFRCVR